MLIAAAFAAIAVFLMTPKAVFATNEKYFLSRTRWYDENE